jgi:hypothetical protein
MKTLISEAGSHTTKIKRAHSVQISHSLVTNAKDVEWALGNRIAPRPVTLEQIEDHLIATGWDVDRVYRCWHLEHMKALATIGRGGLIRPSFILYVRPRDW